jgi:hypothetical protein
VPLSATDIHNFRVRAKAFNLCGRELKDVSAEETNDLLNCKSLDADEEIMVGTEALAMIVKDILRSSYRESGSHWRVEKLLSGCKETMSGFDYRVAYNPDGAPTGVVWMTKEMRVAWLRYGNLVFLDSQKRQMNKLHWPYIGPTVMDNELTIDVICESLVLQEEDQAYAFVMQSLFEMEQHWCAAPPLQRRHTYSQCSQAL